MTEILTEAAQAPADAQLVPTEDLKAVIARLERMQSIGAGILSNASVALRTLRAHVPPPS